MKGDGKKSIQPKKPLNKSRVLGLGFVAIALIIVIILIVPPLLREKKRILPQTPEKQVEPVFRLDGELVFTDSSGVKPLRTISIEISDEEVERQQGLMYRSAMPDSCGMLFIFETQEVQAFWMRNTKIPLDIIYIDSSLEVVSIQKNAVPFSEISLSSFRPAQYVVEVNAGFADANHIVPGTRVKF